MHGKQNHGPDSFLHLSPSSLNTFIQAMSYVFGTLSFNLISRTIATAGTPKPNSLHTIGDWKRAALAIVSHDLNSKCLRSHLARRTPPRPMRSCPGPPNRCELQGGVHCRYDGACKIKAGRWLSAPNNIFPCWIAHMSIELLNFPKVKFDLV